MSIERKVFAALRWAAAAKLVVQLASWAGTLIVVRLLSPHDYGLMAKVAVVCAIAGAVAELGLEAAIVRSANLARADIQKLYGVSLLFGAGMTGLVALAAPLLSRLFHEPLLTWPIVAASLQVVISASAIIPSALWTRDLAFGNLAKIEMAAGLATTAATLVLALLGSGVWALVIGTLVGASVRSTSLLVVGQRVSPIFSPRGIGEHLKSGLTLVSARVSNFVIVQSDVLIGSAFLTTVQIGQYAVALQLATMPVAKVMGLINQITLPAVARQQSDPARVRQAVLKSISVIALVAFPALWGISAIAPELVRVLFGEKWLAAVPALTILPLVVPIRMICSILFTTSFAMGNRRLDFRNTLANLILLPGGFFIGAHWGLVGLCSAWLVSVPLAYSFTLRGVLRTAGIRPIDLVVECGAPAAAAGVMYAAITTLRLVTEQESALAALVTLIFSGAIIYFGAMLLISRRHLVSARNFARSLLNRDAPKTA